MHTFCNFNYNIVLDVHSLICSRSLDYSDLHFSIIWALKNHYEPEPMMDKSEHLFISLLHPIQSNIFYNVSSFNIFDLFNTTTNA